MQQSNSIDKDSTLVVSNNADASSEHDREDRVNECSGDNHGNDDQIQAPVTGPWSVEDSNIREFPFNKVDGMKIYMSDDDNPLFFFQTFDDK